MAIAAKRASTVDSSSTYCADPADSEWIVKAAASIEVPYWHYAGIIISNAPADIYVKMYGMMTFFHLDS
jgi:hypothetical protein